MDASLREMIALMGDLIIIKLLYFCNPVTDSVLNAGITTLYLLNYLAVAQIL